MTWDGCKDVEGRDEPGHDGVKFTDPSPFALRALSLSLRGRGPMSYSAAMARYMAGS